MYSISQGFVPNVLKSVTNYTNSGIKFVKTYEITKVPILSMSVGYPSVLISAIPTAILNA